MVMPPRKSGQQKKQIVKEQILNAKKPNKF
jgi:hypothetical protein